MAIAFDAAATGTANFSASPLTWSHTCTGANLVLFVAVGCNTGAATPGTCTYGAQSMTLVGTGVASGGVAGITEIFGLIAPATGAHTVTFTPAAQSDMAAGSMSFTGCDQVTGWKSYTTASASSATITGTVTGVTAGDWVVAASGSDNAPTISVGTQAFFANLNTGQGAGQVAGGYRNASGSVAITWTQTSGNWAWLGVELIAAASAAQLPPLGMQNLPNFPVSVITSSGWRNAGHSR